MLIDCFLGYVGQHGVSPPKVTIAILEKNSAIWLNTLACPSPISSAATGTTHSNSHTELTLQRAADARADVLGQFLAEQAVDGGGLLAAAAMFDGGEFRPAAAARRNNRSRRPR